MADDAAFVEAIHGAFVRVADLPGEHEHWRQVVSEATSSQDLRVRLAALWERAGGSNDTWPTVVQTALSDWEQARDLVLLALASRSDGED